MDLASITSAAEQTSAESVIGSSGSSVWIGLNEIAVDGVWEWSDGSPFSYSFWDVGDSEPNNYLT